MSTACGTFRADCDAEYASASDQRFERIKKQLRHPAGCRKDGNGARVKGLHSRRNKRWTWGKGFGARQLDLQAFAGAIAFLVTLAAASSAHAVPMNWMRVGNPGNAASSIGMGSVAYEFSMAQTETTNSQYVEFLNKVDANGTNPYGIYNPTMSGTTAAGITFNAGAAPGAKYSVKAGGPSATPAGTTYANMPVNFVSWFSAARYVNWLHNGEQANAQSMETGAYTLNGRTSGALVARNAGAQYWIPSANEWYKAAFFNGSSYTAYPTNSNSQPLRTLTLTGTNSANWGQVSKAASNVGAYANTRSSYGLFDMFGNILEMTDSAGSTAGTYRGFGANYNTPTTNGASWSSSSQGSAFATTSMTVATGFRVAAVPEPSSVVLAVVGIAGFGGASWLRRRRGRQASPVALATAS